MSETLYTEEHEWARIDGGEATCGISAYAAEQLGDIVYVELPEIGRALAAGEEAAVVESVKAASEVYAPLAGTVVAVNEALAGKPETVNENPEGTGWFFRLRLGGAPDTAKLMSKAAYDQRLKELG